MGKQASAKPEDQLLSGIGAKKGASNPDKPAERHDAHKHKGGQKENGVRRVNYCVRQQATQESGQAMGLDRAIHGDLQREGSNQAHRAIEQTKKKNPGDMRPVRPRLEKETFVDRNIGG